MLRFALLLVACFLAPRLEAQLLSTVIQNARIVTMGGTTLEKGTIIFKGDRITAIGADPDVPLLARRIDAAGGVVTPGLIDVHSSLGMTSGGARTGSPAARAADAFDRYATEHLREALRNGVTAVYVSSRGAVGIHGTGAVVRLAPSAFGTLGQPVEDSSWLEIDLGSGQSALARVATFDAVRKQFLDARRYRRDREIYEEDLEEYEEKLKERAAKKAEAEKKGGARKGGESGKGTGGPAAEKGAAEKGAAEKGATEKGATEKGAAPAAGTKPDGKDELKKPAEPRRDRRKELLLRALDRELPVRIEAHRSEDILNALDLGKEFSLDVTLVGATEAHLVADEIASAEVPVVLGNQLQGELHTDGPFSRRSPETGAALGEAGVPWWIGSGALSPGGARFVLANARIAAAASGIEDPGAHALSLVTSHAARLLRVADRIGRLAPGLKADLVLWSGDPLAPGATVRKVFVDGSLAFDAEVRP